MKRVIFLLVIFVFVGEVALRATTPQYRPFDDTDMPGKFQMYQRPAKKAIKVVPAQQNIKLRDGRSYDVLMKSRNQATDGRVVISQQNVQYYNYRGEISETSRVEYNEHIAMKMRKGNAINSMPNTPFVETGDIQSVGYDSNPNEGWGEQVKDEEDDDTSDGPIGDAILPLLLFLLLYTTIRRKI